MIRYTTRSGHVHLTSALALLLAVGCGDSGSGTGGSGGTPVVGGSGGTPVVGGNGGDGGAPVVGGNGGEGGSGGDEGGAGGGDNTPVVDFVAVGTPGWEPVDYHQFSTTLGNQFEFFNDVLEAILPPPGHAFHPQIGIGPGAAHAGPYDNEFAATLTALGYVDKNTFTAAEGLLPEGMMSIFMVIPSAGAPSGSSPDFASGPIIPNTLFPITVQVDAYQDGVLLDGYSYGFDVPALDDQLDPPFDVDGHSHFPMFNANYFDGLEIPGTIVTVIQMTDTDGEGWTITTETAVGP